MKAESIIGFEDAFKRLVRIEGGFSSDQSDPGNWTGGVVGRGEFKGTMYGISAASYPDLNIADLTVADAKRIYRRDWWDNLGAENLHGAITYQLWDMAINSGMGNAKRTMQKAVGVAQDGVFGPVTLGRINGQSLDDVLFKFLAARLRYYTKLTTLWQKNGKGWVNRVADQLEYAAIDN